MSTEFIFTTTKKTTKILRTALLGPVGSVALRKVQSCLVVRLCTFCSPTC